MKHKRRFLILLFFLIAVCGLVTWRVYPRLRQQQLDNRLLAAIQRDDTSTVLSFLAEGANTNAWGDPDKANLSPWQMLRVWLLRESSRDRSKTALEHAFEFHQPHAATDDYSAFDTPDIEMVTLLLERGASFPPKINSYVRVYKGFFHHGDHRAYLTLIVEPASDIEFTFLGTEKQLDRLAKAAIRAGARRN